MGKEDEKLKVKRRRIDREFEKKFLKIENNFEKVFGKIDNVLEYNERQDGMMEDIHEVIHGNGEPEKGLIVKHSRLSEKVASILKTLSLHWSLFITMFALIAGVAIRVFFF